MAKFTAQQVDKQIDGALKHCAGTWASVSKALHMALIHCLDNEDGGGKGDSSKITHLYNGLLELNMGKHAQAVEIATGKCAGIVFNLKDGVIVGKKSKAAWDKVSGEKSDKALLQLSEKGVRSFVQKPDPFKKPAKKEEKGNKEGDDGTTYNIHQTLGKEIGKMCTTLRKLSPDHEEDEVLKDLSQEMVSIKKRIQERIDFLNAEVKKAIGDKLTA